MCVSVRVCMCCNNDNIIIMMLTCKFSLKSCIGTLLEQKLQQVQRPGELLMLPAPKLYP